MPQYKVYAVEPLGEASVPIVVTTAYANAGGYPRGEYFVAIPDKECTFFAQRTKFSTTAFPAGGVALNEELILREVLDQALLYLRTYIAKRGITLPPAAHAFRPEVREDNNNLFVHRWIRGACPDQLVRIAKTTEHQPLYDFIRWVARLDKVDYTDL